MTAPTVKLSVRSDPCRLPSPHSQCVGYEQTPFAPEPVRQGPQHRAREDRANGQRRRDDLLLRVRQVLPAQIRADERQGAPNDTSIVAEQEASDGGLRVRIRMPLSNSPLG